MSKYFTYPMMILGTLITMSFSMFPLIAWLGLEFNTLGFIPLMKNKDNSSSYESMIKYFIIQSITSALFLGSSLLWSYFFSNMNHNLPNNIFQIISVATLMMKLGMIPLHFWLFPLINSLGWTSFLLLMTWQKIAPLIILGNMYSKFLIFSIIMSSLISPFMMITQNSTKMIFTYASIIHLAWSATCNLINFPLILLYLLIYSISFIPIIILFMYWNVTSLPQITFMLNKNKFLIFLSTLSMSGFPPLAMFMTKTMIASQLIQSQMFHFITMFLLFSSLLSTYTYIHFNFPFMMNSFSSYKITVHQSPPFLFLLMTPLFVIPLFSVLFI